MSEPPLALSDETVDEILKHRGIRGWLRVGRVAQVLGLLTLYLFLDTYDVRAAFNERMATRRREKLNGEGWMAGLKTQARDFRLTLIDKTIRLVRYFVFRGNDGF